MNAAIATEGNAELLDKVLLNSKTGLFTLTKVQHSDSGKFIIDPNKALEPSAVSKLTVIGK